MRYLAYHLKKNPLFKIMCEKCWEEIMDGVRICADNAMKSPSVCFCEKCTRWNFRELIVNHFNDWMAQVKQVW